MPDVPPSQTDPRAAGPETSEHGFTKWVAIASSAIAAASVVLAGVGTMLSGLHDVFPAAGWITAAVGFVAGLTALVASVAKYTGGRSAVKVAIENTRAAEAFGAPALQDAVAAASKLQLPQKVFQSPSP
jgi:hypothetical protein